MLALPRETHRKDEQRKSFHKFPIQSQNETEKCKMFSSSVLEFWIIMDFRGRHKRTILLLIMQRSLVYGFFSGSKGCLFPFEGMKWKLACEIWHRIIETPLSISKNRFRESKEILWNAEILQPHSRSLVHNVRLSNYSFARFNPHFGRKLFYNICIRNMSCYPQLHSIFLLVYGAAGKLVAYQEKSSKPKVILMKKLEEFHLYISRSSFDILYQN